MKNIVVAVGILVGLTGTVKSQEAGVFERFLNANAPECVPLDTIKQVASKVDKLSDNQFNFVRALYIAIPPISRKLPPGDSAVVATKDGKAMIALVEGNLACARFLAPDFILSMIIDVGNGENGKIGNPI